MGITFLWERISNGNKILFFRYKKAKNLVFDFLPRKALDGGLGGFSTKKSILESFRSPQFHYGWNVLGMALTILRVILMND